MRSTICWYSVPSAAGEMGPRKIFCVGAIIVILCISYMHSIVNIKTILF